MDDRKPGNVKDRNQRRRSQQQSQTQPMADGNNTQSKQSSASESSAGNSLAHANSGTQSPITPPSAVGSATSRSDLHHTKLPFPWKVQEMLADVEKDGMSHIVSWMHHGKSFKVHDEEEFVKSVMPHYFKQVRLPKADVTQSELVNRYARTPWVKWLALKIRDANDDC